MIIVFAFMKMNVLSDQCIMLNENAKNNLKRLISYRYDRLLVKQETINHLVHKK